MLPKISKIITAAHISYQAKQVVNGTHFRKMMLWIPLPVVLVYIYFFLVDTSSKINFSIVNGTNFANSNWGYVALLFILSPVNSILEAQKWREAVGSLMPGLNGRLALKMIFSGAAAGLVTPSRIGEYGGRLVGVPIKNIPGAILANFYCSMAQNLVNVFFGLVGFLVFNELSPMVAPAVRAALVVCTIIVSVISVLVYYRLEVFLNWAGRYDLIRLITSRIGLKGKIDLKKVRILGYSMVRYTVYVVQYLLVVEVLGFDGGIIEKICLTGIIFLLQSVVLLPSLLAFIARVEISFFVWSYVGANKSEVLLATLLLWVVNLALPAVAGGLWLLLSGKTKTDEELA